MVLAALYFVLALVILPVDGFYSPDSALKWLQVKHLRFVTDLATALPYPGREFDPTFKSVPLGESFFTVHEGAIELVWAPWFALLSWPWHRLFGVHGLHVLPVVCAFTTALIIALWAGRLLGARFRAPALLASALATPVFVYGMLVWEHAISTLFAVVGVWQWLESIRVQQRWRALIAGVSFALAIALRTEVLLLCAALGLALLAAGARERRDSALFALTLAAALAPFVLWNVLRMGYVVPANAARNFGRPSLDYLQGAGASFISDFLWGSRGTWPAIGAIAAAAAIAATRVRNARWRDPALAVALGVFTLAACAALYRTFVQRLEAAHGWFEIAPAILLAVCAICSEAEPAPQPSAAGTLVLLQRTLILYTLFYAFSIVLLSWAGPSGGQEWGPRFVLPVYPLAVPLILHFLARERLRIVRGLGVALLGLGAVMEYAGLTTVERMQRVAAAQGRWLQHIPEQDPLVALHPNWWVPSLLISEYERRPMFIVHDPWAWNEIVIRALQAGRKRVWLVGTGLPDPPTVRALTLPDIELKELMPHSSPHVFSVRCLEMKCAKEALCGRR